MTVYELRKAGNKVLVSHYRFIDAVDKVNPIPTWEMGDSWRQAMSIRGGKTVVTVTFPAMEMQFVGEAVCSRKDNFSYKRGVQIALDRIFKQVREFHGC